MNMRRGLIVGITALLVLGLAPSQGALGADLQEPTQSPGCAATADAGHAAGGSTTIGRNSDPIQSLPAGNGLIPNWSIVSVTEETHTTGGLTVTNRTVVQRGPTTSVASRGGRVGLASPLLTGACFKTGNGMNILTSSFICGGGCINQYMSRTYDTYVNDYWQGHFYGRLEVRLWWTRQYDVQIWFTGPAYTEWRESQAYDCSASPQGRLVSNEFNPVWQTWDRTYDYSWNESWLPVVGTQDPWPMYVFTRTPTSMGNVETGINLPH